MKHAKKLASFLLALVMVFSMGITAFAAEGVPAPLQQGPDSFADNEENGKGKVIVTNAVPNETYKIYQILYLESYDVDGLDPDTQTGNISGGKYAYKANSYWKAFVESTGIKDVYLKTDENGYVTWCAGTGTNAPIAAFAKLANEYAKGQGNPGDADYRAPLAAVSTQTPTAADAEKDTATVTFDNLKLGYYLVDTSLGALCALDTTNETVYVTEKNTVPTNFKQVQEDSDNQYKGPTKPEEVTTVKGTNTADIGQVVNFRSTVAIKNGAENLCFHDEMTAGLTFNGDVSITLNGTPLTNTTDYTVITKSSAADEPKPTDSCTFEIKFTDAFYTKIAATGNYSLVISYSATLNEQAKIGTEENTNTSQVSYGDNNTMTPPSTTITKTYEFPVFKYALGEDKKTENGLSDTHFILKTSEKDANGQAKTDADGNVIKAEIKLVLVSDGKATTEGEADTQAVYRVATQTEIDQNKCVTDIVTNNSGKFKVIGLDADTYYLTETQAHPGYNILDGDVTVVIDNNGNVSKNNTPVTSTGGMVKIQNNSGDELPSTGGIGTTIFYVIGSILLVGAAILLITKKRMSVEK